MNHTSKTQPRIVVVGAGIIGASIAWRLKSAGARVTLVDGEGPGGIASACSFGWINATYGNQRAYFDLRMAAMKEWNILATQFSMLPYQKGGTLYVHYNRVDLPTFYAAHLPWGYELEWVEKVQIKIMEPNLVSVPAYCLLAVGEGTLQVEDAAGYFANEFQKLGGHFLHENISEITTHNGGVTGVKTQNEVVEADHIVIAAGAVTQSLMATLGVHIPMKTPPGLLIQTKPCKPIINRTILTDGLHIQQRPDGSLLAGADFGGGQLNNDPEAGAIELMNRIRKSFHGAENVVFDRYTLGHRPTPEDGMPVIGPASEARGLYVATTHSGATLAPIVSKFVCDELMSGTSIEMFAPFRPSRFEPL